MADLLLTWSEKQWPDVQEAVIGVTFILAASGALILLAWFTLGTSAGRVAFYLLFACAVTVSVHLVGLYLVFTTLIVPALATRHFMRWRLAFSYALARRAMRWA